MRFSDTDTPKWTLPSGALKTSKKTGTFLQKMLKEIDEKIQELIKSDTEVKKKYDLAWQVLQALNVLGKIAVTL